MGPMGTIFLDSCSGACARAPKWSGNTRALARVQLCHRHLDSRTRKLLPRVRLSTVKDKIAFAYLHTPKLRA